MAITFQSSLSLVVPIGYTAPPWPLLYMLRMNGSSGLPLYLYFKGDITKFTVIWTVILYLGVYGAAGVLAASAAYPPYKRGIGSTSKRSVVAAGILGVYAVVGAVSACASGSVVGILAGMVYEAGGFKMSTWLPVVLAASQVLYVVVSGYPISNGML